MAQSEMKQGRVLSAANQRTLEQVRDLLNDILAANKTAKAGKHLPGSHDQSTHASGGSMNAGVARFEAAGGTTSEPLRTGSNEHQQAQQTLNDMDDLLGKEFRLDEGAQFTRMALSADSAEERIIVANLPGTGLAGAARYHAVTTDTVYTEDDVFGNGSSTVVATVAPHLNVSYMGTTGIAEGTGSAMTRQVIKEAAQSNLGIVVEPATPGARSFWSKMGMHTLPGLEEISGDTYIGMTATETRQIAASL